MYHATPSGVAFPQDLAGGRALRKGQLYSWPLRFSVAPEKASADSVETRGLLA